MYRSFFEIFVLSAHRVEVIVCARHRRGALRAGPLPISGVCGEPGEPGGDGRSHLGAFSLLLCTRFFSRGPALSRTPSSTPHACAGTDSRRFRSTLPVTQLFSSFTTREFPHHSARIARLTTAVAWSLHP